MDASSRRRPRSTPRGPPGERHLHEREHDDPGRRAREQLFASVVETTRDPHDDKQQQPPTRRRAQVAHAPAPVAQNRGGAAWTRRRQHRAKKCA